MFPGDVNSGSHTVCQDNKFRGPAVIMGAKAYDVDLRYSQQTVAARVSLSLKIPLNLSDRLV
jgi:hypothetical protein